MDNLQLDEKLKLLQALKDKADMQDKEMQIPMQPAPLEDMTPEKAAELDAQAVRGPASVETPMDNTIIPLQPKGAFMAKDGVPGQEASPDLNGNEQNLRFQKLKVLLQNR